MHLTKEILKDYVERGLVVENQHRELPLTIYNYSRKCQYDSAWDEVTLQCRGLIMDEAGTIVARGFNKFFNYEEALRMGTVPVDSEYCYVQEKMDGSLGILFYYAGDWHMATRGSFHSDQAVKGLEILKSKYRLKNLMETAVYLVEIIYPENRIVVKYPDERLVFLSVIMNGTELNWAAACAIFIASKIDGADVVGSTMHRAFGPELYEDLKARNSDNSEGFVLRFYPGNFRMKIKFDEYVRLHKLLTEFSNVDIWQTLAYGRELDDFLEMVPDEFDTWVRDWERALKFAWVMKKREAETHFTGLLAEGRQTRKESAQWIQANVPQEMWSVLFNIMDGKDPSPHFWKMIKPDYQKPFWNKEDSEEN